MHLNGKKMVKWVKLTGNRQMDRRLMLMENFSPWGVVCPCPGAIYMYISIIMKHLLPSNGLANQSQTSYGAFLGRGKESFNKWSRPMFLKLGVKHQ